MKTFFLLTLALFGWSLTTSAQSVMVRDSLLKKFNALPVTANDTARANVLNALALEYYLNKPDTTFFTTKATGEGTGLGLSLIHDIVTKGHGGEMTAESIPGEGTVFVVRLPVAVIA